MFKKMRKRTGIKDSNCHIRFSRLKLSLKKCSSERWAWRKSSLSLAGVASGLPCVSLAILFSMCQSVNFLVTTDDNWCPTGLNPGPHALYSVCCSCRSTDIQLWSSLPWMCWRYSIVYQDVSTSDNSYWLTARMCGRAAILVLEQWTVTGSRQVSHGIFRNT